MSPYPLSPGADVPALDTAFALALGGYVLTLGLSLWRPTLARRLLFATLGVHFGAMALRGMSIGAFPLTNKFESFSAAALGVGLALAIHWRPRRWFVLGPLVLAVAALATAFSFGTALNWPPPLMQTLWYPLHVPLSFASYGWWTVAAAAGLAWWFGRDPAWLGLIDRLVLQGFGIWTLSMICGGIWGVLAWGAYFMWDPKIIWSVILWFHYGSFLHVRFTPSLRGRPWVRPVLAGLGWAWVLVAYVGTSFFFGKSSHAFG